jgi:hypothetical protein
LTPDLAAKLLNVIRSGGWPETGAALAGISRTRFRSWLRRPGEPYETLRDLIVRAESFAEVHALQMVRLSGDWRVAMAYLSRRYPENWRAAASEKKLDTAMLSLLRAVGLAPPKRPAWGPFWQFSPKFARKRAQLADTDSRTP